jgi:hypothetical protein
MTAYIASLNRALETTAQTSAATPGLRQRFIEWYSCLPEISQNRPFAMIELEAALSTQGKYLSPILLALGWHRKRKWTSHGQYSRYWLPPKRDWSSDQAQRL